MYVSICICGLCVSMCIWMCLPVCKCVYASVPVHVCVCVSVHMYMCVCFCVHVCVSMCVSVDFFLVCFSIAVIKQTKNSMTKTIQKERVYFSL